MKLLLALFLIALLSCAQNTSKNSNWEHPRVLRLPSTHAWPLPIRDELAKEASSRGINPIYHAIDGDIFGDSLVLFAQVIDYRVTSPPAGVKDLNASFNTQKSCEEITLYLPDQSTHNQSFEQYQLVFPHRQITILVSNTRNKFPFRKGELVEISVDPHLNITQIFAPLELREILSSKTALVSPAQWHESDNRGLQFPLSLPARTPYKLTPDGAYTDGPTTVSKLFRKLKTFSETQAQSGQPLAEPTPQDSYLHWLGDYIVYRNSKVHSFSFAKGPGAGSLAWVIKKSKRAPETSSE